MIEKFNFFRSYSEVFKTLKETGQTEEAALLIAAMCDYVFEDKEPDEDFMSRPTLKMLWAMILQNLKNSVDIEKRTETNRENGKKGGRPKKENPTETEIKTQPKPNRNPTNRTTAGNNGILEKPNQNPTKNPTETENDKSVLNRLKPDIDIDIDIDIDKDIDELSLDCDKFKNPPATLAMDAVEFEDGEPVDATVEIEQPTKEQVFQYVKDKGYIGYVNFERFYNHYSQYHWRVNGLPIDWRSKCDEWAIDDKNKQIRGG